MLLGFMNRGRERGGVEEEGGVKRGGMCGRVWALRLFAGAGWSAWVVAWAAEGVR